MTHNIKKQKGFTLIEMLVSVFIFLLIMLAVMTVFTREIEAYRNAKQTQRSLENAQFAMSFVAKILRTSTITGPNIDDWKESQAFLQKTEVYAYDFSQNTCFHFEFGSDDDGEALFIERDEILGQTGNQVCNVANTFSSLVRLTTGQVRGKFYGGPSRAQVTDSGGGITQYGQIGRMTISMEVEPPAQFAQRRGAASPIHIQTTVGLRDYDSVGLRQ